MTSHAYAPFKVEAQAFLRDNRTRGKRQAITVYEGLGRAREQQGPSCYGNLGRFAVYRLENNSEL